MIELEICVADVAGVVAAVEGGAQRIELCAALEVGGLTPTSGLVDAALAVARPAGVTLHAMVRPRSGDFAYTAAELNVAVADACWLIDRGVDGLVFGAARDGALDDRALAAFVAAVHERSATTALTLHRAIDTTRAPATAAGRAAELGFDRILTSGGAPSACDGAATIAAMVAQVGGRCRIMAGAGVRADNAAALVAATGVAAVHASASEPLVADPRAAELGFAPQPRRTDPAAVRALRTVLDTIAEDRTR